MDFWLHSGRQDKGLEPPFFSGLQRSISHERRFRKSQFTNHKRRRKCNRSRFLVDVVRLLTSVSSWRQDSLHWQQRRHHSARSNKKTRRCMNNEAPIHRITFGSYSYRQIRPKSLFEFAEAARRLHVDTRKQRSEKVAVSTCAFQMACNKMTTVLRKPHTDPVRWRFHVQNSSDVVGVWSLCVVAS